MRTDYGCSAGCEGEFGFAYVDRGMICLGCAGPAVPVKRSSMQSILWRGQQEQVVELDRMFAL